MLIGLCAYFVKNKIAHCGIERTIGKIKFRRIAFPKDRLLANAFYRRISFALLFGVIPPDPNSRCRLSVPEDMYERT